MLFLYNVFATLSAPIWVTWMLWRSWRRREAPDWRERMGEYRIGWRPGGRRIWFHAVSVGEVVAALPMMRRVRELAPDAEVLLTATTPAGLRTARERACEWVDHFAYAPMDVLRFAFGAMVRARPHVLAVMETELWMNLLWSAKVVRARTLLVNGRISDRSFPRARLFRFFYSALLRHVDEALMQTDEDAARIRVLGAGHAEVLGNCKFDEALDGLDAEPEAWRAQLGLSEGLPVIVVGSTRGEEEERFVDLALAELTGVAVVHAPRHLDRVPTLAAREGRSLRSKGGGSRYVILDTHGELSRVYSVADVVVIGGGFAKLGGQNLIQALAHGKPVLHGPHMQNFRDVATAAGRAGCAQVCRTPAELAEALRELLADPERRARMGEAARSLVESNAGASDRYAQRIVAALEAAVDGEVRQPS